jgi:hypothetical protein
VRSIVSHVLTAGRERVGMFATPDSFGFTGRFHLVCPSTGRNLTGIGSEAADWEAAGMPLPAWDHVSVSLAGRSTCPSWPEMEWVRGLFWGEEETVFQFHPPTSAKVNFHPGCLHLWKPVGVEIPLPPSICVGPEAGAPAGVA